MAASPIQKLVQSLNQGELKQFSLKVKKANNTEYNKIFQSIRLGKEPQYTNKNTFSQRKKYLYDTLIELLNNSTNSIDAIILKKLLSLETLFKRQLNILAFKEANKAQKLAEKHERYGLLIQIFEWKKNIGYYLEDFTRQDYFDLSEREEHILNEQLCYLKAKNKYMEILNLKREFGYLNSDHDRTIFSKYGEINQSTESNRTLFYSRMTKAIYHWMLKEHDEEYKLTKINIQSVDIDVDNVEFMIAHLEHLTSCVCNANFAELVSTLNNLKSKNQDGFFGKNMIIDLKLFYYSANYEILSYAHMGNMEQLRLKVNEVESEISAWGSNMSKEMLSVIYTALKMGHYYLGDVKKSKYYINKMINNYSGKIRKDVYFDALLFNLIIIFDNLEDIDYLDSNLNSTIRFLKINNMKNSFEYLFASSLRKHIHDDRIFEKVYNDLEPKFHKYFYKLKNGKLYSENYQPIYLWLLSKVKNEPFIKVVKNWSKS